MVDADAVQEGAEAAYGAALAVRAAEAAELSATLEMGFEVEDHARDAALGEFFFELRDHVGEVAEDRFVSAVAQFGRPEVFELVLVDVLTAAGGARGLVVLDVHPPGARL